METTMVRIAAGGQRNSLFFISPRAVSSCQYLGNLSRNCRVPGRLIHVVPPHETQKASSWLGKLMMMASWLSWLMAVVVLSLSWFRGYCGLVVIVSLWSFGFRGTMVILASWLSWPRGHCSVLIFVGGREWLSYSCPRVSRFSRSPHKNDSYFIQQNYCTPCE